MGLRPDGRNLFHEWEKLHYDKYEKYALVWNKEQFDAVDVEEIDFLLGKWYSG